MGYMTKVFGRRAATVAMAAFAMTVGVPAGAVEQSEDDATIRLVNNRLSKVRVFVFDANDRRFELGVVEAGGVAALQLSAEMIEGGAVRLRAYPMGEGAGLGTPAAGENGVGSSQLELKAGDTIDFWVESELNQSALWVTSR